jgi:hypothetical protein
MNVTFKTNNLNDMAILVQLAKRLNIEIEQTDNTEKELQINELTELSFQSFEKIWSSEEDATWEEFFKETQLNNK